MGRNGKRADREPTPRIGQGTENRCGLIIGVPTRGNTRIEWAMNLRQLAEPMSMSWAMRTCTGEQVDTARNTLVRAAIEEGADFLFFLDDDTMLPHQTLFKLTYEMAQHPDADLITAVVPTRSEPPVPTIFKWEGDTHLGPYWDWDYGKVFEIDACGMAATLIRVSAFDKMEAPWFLNTRGRSNSNEGEDTYFCRRLREAGGKLLADGSLLCGHLAENGKLFQIAGDTRPFRNVDMKKLTPAATTEA